jgi:hypothetical protein
MTGDYSDNERWCDGSEEEEKDSGGDSEMTVIIMKKKDDDCEGINNRGGSWNSLIIL